MGIKIFQINSFYFWTKILLGSVFGILNMYHVSSMFENDTHFSHLSNLEREMCFRSEMGLYYSYYKTIIEAKTFADGYDKIVLNNITEYPNTIDTLNRFNLYPEIIFGLLYRKYTEYAKLFDIKTKECWTVDRGFNLMPAISCEGSGDPVYFYLRCIWFLSGLTVFLLFIYGVYLSDSMMGGVITALAYFFNHSEATRVQWAPPLRENFAYPFVILQMLMITYFLKNYDQMKVKFEMIIITTTTVICLLLWQFSQFYLSTQLIAVYLVYQLNIIPKTVLRKVINGHIIAIFITYALMHGNKLLLSSIHFAIASSMIISSFLWQDAFFLSKQNIYLMFVRLLHNSGFIICFTIFIKANIVNLIIQNNDDEHIINLLRSKFTNYNDFHTMLYTRAPEFDFLPFTTWVKLFYTLLIPLDILLILIIFINWYTTDIKTNSTDLNKMENIIGRNKAKERNEKKYKSANYEQKGKKFTKSELKNYKDYVLKEVLESKKINENEMNKAKEKNLKQKQNSFMNFVRSYKLKTEAEPEILYNILQTIAFAIMSTIIMRLKLFFTPHLCIIASLSAAERYLRFSAQKYWIRLLFVIFLLLGMSIKGIVNIKEQRNILGEFTNEPLEDMLMWINTSTSTDSVFAGPMSITSSIMLSTNRAIVNHPHYENARIREITKTVYSVYSRNTLLDVYSSLVKLDIQYIVLDVGWCFIDKNSVYNIVDLFDHEEPELKHRPVLCEYLLTSDYIKPFNRVYENTAFTILKLDSNFVNVNFNNLRTYKF